MVAVMSVGATFDELACRLDSTSLEARLSTTALAAVDADASLVGELSHLASVTWCQLSLQAHAVLQGKGSLAQLGSIHDNRYRCVGSKPIGGRSNLSCVKAPQHAVEQAWLTAVPCSIQRDSLESTMQSALGSADTATDTLEATLQAAE